MGARRWGIGLMVAFGAVWGLGTTGYHFAAKSALEQFRAQDPYFTSDAPQVMWNPLRIGTKIANINTLGGLPSGTTIENLTVSTPLTAPNRVRASLDGTAKMSGNLIESDSAWVEAGFHLNTRAEIRSLDGRLREFQSSRDEQTLVSLSSADLTMRNTEGAEYEMSFAGRDVIIPSLADLFADQSLNVVSSLTFDGFVEFERPISFLEDAETNPITSIDFAPMTIIWGDLDVILTGRLDIDALGDPSGRLDMSIKGWEIPMQLLADQGVINRATVPGYSTMIGGLADAEGRVTLPLILANGQIKLGPFPMGPAPRLR